MTDTIPLGQLVVRLKVPVKNMPVGTELGYKDVPDAIAALGSAAFFDVVRDQQGNPIPPLTPEEIEEAQRAAQRRAKSRRLILGADFDPLWNRVEGIPSAEELTDMQAAVEAVADVPPRVEAVEDTVSSVQSTVAILAYNTYDVADYGAVRGSVDAAQRTANTAAINAASADAAANGGVLVIKGEYEVDDTITVRSHMDGSSGSLTVYDTAINPVMRVGNAANGQWIADLIVIAPAIRQGGKTTSGGWSGLDCGIEFVNLNTCHVTTRRITNFSTNMRLIAHGTGCVYNDFTLGWLENGKVNLHLDKGNSTNNGWIQENIFINGRFHQNGGEGVNVPGTRHILLDALVSNNVFLKPSVEGNTAEYHVEIGGSFNQVINARWEAEPPRVRLHSGTGNAIVYGYGAQNIVLTDTGSQNHIYSRNGLRVMGAGHGVVTGWGGGGLQGVFVVVSDATSNPETEYQVSIAPTVTRFKSKANPHPKIEIHNVNGLLTFGNGSAAPHTSLQAFGTVGLQVTGNGYFRVGTQASLPNATSAYRGMMIRVEGGSGVADELYTCRKTAGDTYEWVKLTP